MSASLARHFARRVAPLAALAGIAVAVVSPLTFHLVTWGQLERQAEIYAGQVGHGVRGAVFSQPRLWRYNAAKIVQAALLQRAQRDVAAIEIRDGCGEPVLASEMAKLGSGVSGGPAGSAWVEVLGQPAAKVTVRIDPAEHWLSLLVIILVSGPLGAGIGLLLYAFPTHVVRQQERSLAEANSELRDAQAELTAVNRGLQDRVAEGVERVKQLSRRVVQIQEDERRRIARDLHDGIGQAITGLQLELELAQARPGERGAHLDKAVAASGETLAELRRVVREIRPPEIDAAELPDVLRAQAESFEQRTGITTSVRLRVAGHCADEVAICLLRLVQEALTNVQRHAQAQEVSILLHLEADRVLLEIQDDGLGFDSTAARTGVGLQGMRERCEFLNGQLVLDTAPGAGTRLRFELPLEAGDR